MQVRWKNTSAHSRVSRSRASTACYCSPILPTMRTQAKLPSLAAVPVANGISATEQRGGGRPHVVRSRQQRPVPSSRLLCGPDSAGRKVCRSARTAAQQVCTRDQPQDRQGTWHYSPPDVARDRRRGNRIGEFLFFAAPAHSRL